MQARSLALALWLATGCTSTSPQPNSPAIATDAQAGFYRTRVGAAAVTVVSDGTLPLDVTGGLALDAKPGEIERALADHAQASPIDASFNEFVIAAEGHVALIDTGAASNFGPTVGKLARSLSNAGLRAADITDVFLTHIHPDHAGGLVVDGKPAFPNATVHVDARDLAYWMDADLAAKATGTAATFFATARAALAPYAAEGRIETFAGATEFFAGFRAEPAYGHTPGHVVYVLENGGQKLVFLGDMIHIPAVQFADPAVAVAFDVDPAAAVATRKRVLGEVADRGELVAHDHVAFPGLGHVRRDGEGYRWLAAPYVNDAK